MADTEHPPRAWATALVALLVRRKWWFVCLVVAGAVATAPWATRWFKADNSARVWLLEGDPALVAYDAFQDTFGNDEVVIIAVSDSRGIYHPEVLEGIRAASVRIRDMELIRRVTSIGVSRLIDGDAVQMYTDPLLEDGAVTEQTAAKLRKRVAADPAVRDTLVNADETMTLIVAQLKKVDVIAGQRGVILDEVRRIVDQELRKRGASSYLGGIGVIYDELNRAVLRDTTLFIGLSMLVILLGLWLLFRRVIWLVLGMVIIGVATTTAVGLFGLFERKMNMVSSIIPTLILTVGILDLVHLVDAQQTEAARKTSARRTFAASLAVVVIPCIFNSITDAIGFLALASARMQAIRDFGILAALGLLLLLSSTLAIAVPALSRFGHLPPKRDPESGLTARATRALGRFASRFRALVVLGGVVLTVVAGLGILQIKVDTYTIEFLRESHRARQDHNHMQKEFGYYIPLELVVDAGTKGGAKSPDLLRRVDDIERAFEGHKLIGRVTGLPEIVKRINQLAIDGAKANYRIPDTRGAVAQELLLYEMDEHAELDTVLDGDERVTRITARTGMTTARGVRTLVRELEHTGQAQLASAESAEGVPAPTIRATGYLPLYVQIIRHITRAQLTSFGIAFLLVTVVLMLLLRSLKHGLIALVPNLMPTIVTLGFMGWVGIRLDVGTVLLASIAIGISVNDTTHLMFRYRHELARAPNDAEAALDRTLAATGRAIFASSLMLMAGFAVIGLASTRSVSTFGILSAVTVASALIADLVITPALLLLTKQRTRPAT